MGFNSGFKGLMTLREALAIFLSDQHKTHKCPWWQNIPVFLVSKQAVHIGTTVI